MGGNKENEGPISLFSLSLSPSLFFFASAPHHSFCGPSEPTLGWKDLEALLLSRETGTGVTAGERLGAGRGRVPSLLMRRQTVVAATKKLWHFSGANLKIYIGYFFFFKWGYTASQSVVMYLR